MKGRPDTPHAGRAALDRWQRGFQHLANLAVIGTGLVYFVMKHLLSPADPWAVVNHPWQPAVQHLHVLAAPVLVFAVGLLWSRHVAPGVRAGRRNRRSGWTLVLGFAPMAASGYLLQISTGEAWRAVWLWVHLATSALWIAGYAAHALGALALRRRARRQAAAREASPVEVPDWSLPEPR